MNKFMFQPFVQWLTESQAFSETASQNKAPIHNKIFLWTSVNWRLFSLKNYERS